MKNEGRYYSQIQTPIGRLTLVEEAGGIAELRFEGEQIAPAEEKETELLKTAKQQLSEYFAGTRREFDLPLSLRGTEFQKQDWEALRTIPYGEIRSYGEIAAQIGKPRACRAVGMANHRNPVSIIVPCHRVVGSDGSLTGYGGGLDVKVHLLELEGLEVCCGKVCRSHREAKK